MRSLTALACAAVLLVAALAYTAHAQFGSQGGFTTPQELLPWPITAGGDLDMNGNNIDNVATLTSDAADPADAGVIRLGNDERICWEADPTGTDVCAYVNTAERLIVNNTLQVSGQVISGSHVVLTSGNLVRWSSLVDVESDTIGQLIVREYGTTTGVTFDVNDTADTLVLKDFSGTGPADFRLSTGGEIQLGTGSTSPVIQAAGETITFNLQSGPNEAIIQARELIASSKITLTTATKPLRWSGASQMDSVADGRIRVRVADGTAGTCFIVSGNSFDARKANCSSPAEIIGRYGTQVSAAPSAPVTCDSNNFGYREYVKDSNDGGSSELCICGMNDDTTYDWKLADGTACPFF